LKRNLKIESNNLVEQLAKAKKQLFEFELSLLELTNDSMEGERWRISSSSIELLAVATNALDRISKLLTEANKYWFRD
jgi:hypothetical protein